MNSFFEILFSQYQDTPTHLVMLEMVAVFLGLGSALFAKKQNILAFPFGIISTSIFIYLLALHRLWGNMLINAYYTVFSFYGWFLWSRKDEKIQQSVMQVRGATQKEWLLALLIFVSTVVLVICVYRINFDGPLTRVSYLDIITTSMCCSAMLFMARKIIANWILFVIADILVLPMYFYENLYFTTLQFIILTFIGCRGYLEWKKYLPKEASKQSL